MEERLYVEGKTCDSSEHLKNYMMERKSSSREGSPNVSTSGLPVVTITAANLTGMSAGPGACKSLADTKGSLLEKAEINEAVTKVLQGYNWSLVPSPTK